MSYEEHGLTKLEDSILGAFGHMLSDEGTPTDCVHPDMIEVPIYMRDDLAKATKALQAKGYLQASQDTAGNEVYYLTIKGKTLWKVRAKEEEAGPKGLAR